MATITSLGIGSGLDLNNIVTQLVALERKPIGQMQQKANQLQTQVSSFGQIKSLMSAVQTASNALTDPLLWTRSAVSSGDAGVVSVQSGSNVAAGNYAVTVQSLASTQTLASSTTYTDSSALIGAGTLNLQLGAWDGTQSNFTAKTGSNATQIEVTAEDTVQTLRDKINGAGAGVTASLVTDSSGVRLSLRSTSTGAQNGFRLQATDNDGNDALGLSLVAFDPPNGATAMQLMQGSADAKATVNGIAVASSSNTLSGVIDGLTLNLNKVSASAVNVSATSDRGAVGDAIKTFASAYNAMVSYIGEQTKYDPTAKVGGNLQGDSAATNLQERLRGMVGASTGASSTFSRLSDLGLQVQRDGTLLTNQTQLDAATGNLAELKRAFVNSDVGNSGNDGFARRYANLATQALGVDGILTTRTAGLQKLIAKNGDDQSALNDRVDTFQRRLVAQYTALDAKVAQLNSLSSYVTQQVAQWTKNSSSA